MAKKSSDVIEKEHYEMLIAKKQYEQLMRPWFKRIEIWKVIVTSSLTLITVVVLYKNGLFDFRTKELQLMNTALEVKKDNLEYDIKKFSGAKDSMYLIREQLLSENRNLLLKNMQIDIANKHAYASLNQREKFFVQVQLRNVELERKNQGLTDAALIAKNTIAMPYYSNLEINKSALAVYNDSKLSVGLTSGGKFSEMLDLTAANKNTVNQFTLEYLKNANYNSTYSLPVNAVSVDWSKGIVSPASTLAYTVLGSVEPAIINFPGVVKVGSSFTSSFISASSKDYLILPSTATSLEFIKK